MASEPPLADDLALALELIGRSSDIALEHLRRGVDVESKADGTQVTGADIGVERFLLGELSRRRPGDGIFGEELGARGADRRRWILDPIDGTANFIDGAPQWGTHIALERDGEVVLGAISRPLSGVVWWAVRGGGAHRADVRAPTSSATAIHVSHTSRLDRSTIAVWAQPPHPALDRIRDNALLADADLDAILHLAEGRLDAVVDPTGRAWDHAPAVVLIEEAGGRFSDATSGRRIDQGEARYSNGAIHEALVRVLAT